jgi:hypothetical protein
VSFNNAIREGLAARRRVFVSYHHAGDQRYKDALSAVFHDHYQVIFDNSLDRARDSDDHNYIVRYIRENHLTGSSCTIVLCGAATHGRKYVDWELQASLYQQMGLLALQLPTLVADGDGKVTVPQRVADNIRSGYAVWTSWETATASTQALSGFIEHALNKSKTLIDNSAQRLQRNRT